MEEWEERESGERRRKEREERIEGRGNGERRKVQVHECKCFTIMLLVIWSFLTLK